MSTDESLLLDYLLGHLDETDSELASVLSRPDADQRLNELGNSMEFLTRDITEVAPSASLRSHILSSISASAPNRLGGLGDRLSRFFGMGLDKARQLLDSIGHLDRSVWESSGYEGVYLQHIDCEGDLAGADCGLVHLDPGVNVDHHEHLGDEWMLILEGFVTTDQGRELGMGDLLHSAAGSHHAFTVDPDHRCVFAVILHEGIRWIDAQTRSH